MWIKRNINVDLKVIEASRHDVMSDIARFDREYRPFATAGRVVLIRCGSKKVYVVARGLQDGCKNEISLDSAIREKLEVNAGQIFSFNIESANPIDDFLWAWGATDAMPRIAARLGVISVALGALGLCLGIVSLCQ